MFLTLVVLIHIVGIFISRKCAFDRCDDDIITSQTCPNHMIGVYLSLIASMFEFANWMFISTAYVFLFINERQITLATGLCPIIAVCASTISYCLSRERGKLMGRELVKQSREMASNSRPSTI